MFERVRQSLLDNPVRRQLDADRQLASLSVDGELDGQARVSKLSDERGHVSEPRLRGERIVRVTAEHAKQPAGLGERAPPALLDRLEHLASGRVRVIEEAPLGAGLENDHRDVVCDHVVQFTRDPRALLDDRLTRGDVALALGDPSTAVAVADHTSDEEHHDALDDAERDRLLECCPWPGARGEDRRQHEREAGCETAWRRPDRQRIQRTEVCDRLREDVRAGPEREFH